PSSHAMPSFAGWPLAQMPALHLVFAVQRLPSSQAAPSLPGMDVHTWSSSSHIATKQGPGGEHGMGWPPPHDPPLHTVSTVQKSPSSQAKPSNAGSPLQP